MKTIAIIDDDTYINDLLSDLLTREGYAVLRAYSGTEALMLLSRSKPDLVLLDLMLPGLTGEEILPKIKSIPTIIISAKCETEGKVRLLLDGAVDYITKPFEVSELLARVAVHLRTPVSDCAELRYEDISLDFSSHSVTVCSKELRLTKTEFAILKTLIKTPGQVIAKSVILDRISIDTPDCMESSLKVHVSNLRKKLREASGHDYIEAVWGIGFKLEKEE